MRCYKNVFLCVQSVKDNFQIFSILCVQCTNWSEQGNCYVFNSRQRHVKDPPWAGAVLCRSGFLRPTVPEGIKARCTQSIRLDGWCQSESLSPTPPPECVPGSSLSLSLSQSFMVAPIMKSSLRTLQAGFSSAAAACKRTHTRYDTAYAYFLYCVL